MPREQLPPEVTRHLSTHGEVLLTVGDLKEGSAATRCAVAPFDEVLYLFVRPGSPAAERMRRDTRASVQAADADKGYVIRLEGRAVAGPRVRSHPSRLSLMAWLPEGHDPQRWEAASFFVDRVDYQRGEERFVGQVPRDEEPPGSLTLWVLAAFQGGWTYALLGVAGIWAWIIYQGSALPLRGVAMPVAGVGALGLIAAGGLWFRASHFLDALGRSGRAPHAALLTKGLLAPGAVSAAAGMALGVGVFFTLLTAMWGWGLFLVTLVCSFTWIHWPIRVTAVFHGEDEGRSTD